MDFESQTPAKQAFLAAPAQTDVLIRRELSELIGSAEILEELVAQVLLLTEELLHHRHLPPIR